MKLKVRDIVVDSSFVGLVGDLLLQFLNGEYSVCYGHEERRAG